MGRKPEVVADSSGITFRRGAKVTWSEVTSVEPPPDNGWKHQRTDLVLRVGTRRLLAFDLDPSDLRRITGLLAASRKRARILEPVTESKTRVHRNDRSAA
jgi:hypothetical protein